MRAIFNDIILLNISLIPLTLTKKYDLGMKIKIKKMLLGT